MLEESFGLLIYLKKPKNYSKGSLPVYLRITVDGIAKELSLNRSCEKNRWNSFASRLNGTKEDAKELSMFLDTLRLKFSKQKGKFLKPVNKLQLSDLWI